jgi:hypothetical protein
MYCQPDCESCRPDCECASDTAEPAPTHELQVEDGTGDGQEQQRSNAENKGTILLERAEARALSLTVSQPSEASFWLVYSNDGPGTTDVVRVAVGDFSSDVELTDTRGNCQPGDGWNSFCRAEVSGTATLEAGTHQITLTVRSADVFGVELDALLVVLTPSVDGCDMTVSSVQGLRDAIAQAPADTLVCVQPGEYEVSETIDIPRSDLTIEGTGDDTVFRLASGANCPVFVIGEPMPFAPSVTRQNITLRKMRVDGNRTQQDSETCSVPGREFLRNNGITVRQARDCTLEDVTIENARSGGIVLEQSCRNVQLIRVQSSENEFDGIAWDGDIQGSLISGCDLSDNLAAGLSFDIGPTGNRVENTTIEGNQSVGIFIRDSDDNCFIDCQIEMNAQDCVFIADGDAPGADATGNVFKDIECRNSGRNGFWQAGEQSVENCVVAATFEGNAESDIEESFPESAPLLIDDACMSDVCD